MLTKKCSKFGESSDSKLLHRKNIKTKKFQILKVINTSQVYLQTWMNEPLQTEKVGELSLSHSFSISKLVC
jgi:hypothetical protein